MKGSESRRGLVLVLHLSSKPQTTVVTCVALQWALQVAEVK